MFLELKRIASQLFGRFGVLNIDGVPFCVTLEPGMESKYDSIPVGVYDCKRYSSEKYPDTWEIKVPGRTAILFHSGNVQSHTKGCILLAQHFGKIKGNPAVLNSGMTFNVFMMKTNGLKEMKIKVVET